MPGLADQFQACDTAPSTECIAAVVKRIDPAAAVSLMDLSVEAECFGSRTEFMENEVPSVKGALVSSAADAHKLKIPDLTAGRAGVYLDTLKKVKDRIDDRPVLAGVIGPFSLAGRLVDVTMDDILIDEPEILKVQKNTNFVK